MRSPSVELEISLLQERLRLHRAGARWSVASALGVAVALLLQLDHSVPAANSLVWACTLALALALRLAVPWDHARRADQLPAADWLFRYRLSYLLHGLVWMGGALAVLMMPPPQPRMLLVLTLTVLTAGGLITAAFDWVAGLAFGLPTLTPLMLSLFLNGRGGVLASLFVALIFLVVLGFALRRAELNLRLATQLRLNLAHQVEQAAHMAADAERARAELAEQHLLTTQLLAATREGSRALRVHASAVNSITDVVSVLDEHEVYHMVNDTWCQRTGLRREEVLGRRAQDFMPALATERRSQGLRDCLKNNAVQTQLSVLDLPAVRGRLLLTPLLPRQRPGCPVRPSWCR